MDDAVHGAGRNRDAARVVVRVACERYDWRSAARHEA